VDERQLPDGHGAVRHDGHVRRAELHVGAKTGAADAVDRPSCEEPVMGVTRLFGIVSSAALLLPAHAAADSYLDWDFSDGPAGWTSQTVNYANFPWYQPNAWVYRKQPGSWGVDAQPVINSSYWVANYLTSPVFTVPDGTDQFDVVIRHRFNFETSTGSGEPLVLGQFVYRINDPLNPRAPFLPLGAAEWLSEPVEPPYDVLSPWPKSVLPTFDVPAGLNPMIPGGLAFTGSSPGRPDDWVFSRVLVDGQLFTGQQIQLRFITGNLGLDCLGSGWEVSLVSVTAVAPEPGSLALAGSAAALGLGAAAVRRRRAGRLSSVPPGRS